MRQAFVVTVLFVCALFNSQYLKAETLVLQPGPEGKDVIIIGPTDGENDWQADVNFENSAPSLKKILTANWANEAPNAGLIEFDLSSVVNLDISSATLSLFHGYSSDHGGTYDLHENLDPWSESTVTWNNSPSFSSSPVATTTIPDNLVDVWRDWDITSSVDKWLTDPSSNFGLRLMREDHIGPSAYFASSDVGNPDPSSWFVGLGSEYAPKLTIDYNVFGPPEPYEPKTYGVFFGMNYEEGKGHADLLAGNTAYKMRNKFVEANIIDANNAYVITNEILYTTESYLKNTLNIINEKMNPEDKLILFMRGHGSSSITLDYETEKGEDGYTTADEYMRFQNIPTDPTDPNTDEFIITDDELTSMLSVFSDDIEKWVFIDSCYSGGFFNDNKNSTEISGDLNRISNLGFIASATELKESIYSGLTGESHFANAMYFWLTAAAFGFFDITFDGIANDMKHFYKDYEPGTLFYPSNGGVGLGEEGIPWSPDMWNPYFATTEGFDGVLRNNGPVPEPTTILLFAFGLLGLAGVGRRKK